MKCFRDARNHGFERGLPNKQYLKSNPSVASFLRHMVVAQQTDVSPDNDAALNVCYRHGWLQAELSADECTGYIFSTHIHRR